MKKSLLVVVALGAMFFLATVILVACGESPRQSAEKIYVPASPTPRLDEAMRLINEQLKKEAAEETQKKAPKNGGKKTALARH